jgi:hypothetical protein
VLDGAGGGALAGGVVVGGAEERAGGGGGGGGGPMRLDEYPGATEPRATGIWLPFA